MLRIDRNNYFEAVLAKNNLAEIMNKLSSFFGAPQWPSEKQLSTQILNIIKDFGGVRDDQTLYFCNEKNYSVFAMLWPWMDGQRITLKLARSNREV